MAKTLKRKTKKQSGMMSGFQLYRLLTVFIPGSVVLIVFLIAVFGDGLGAAVFYIYGLAISAVLAIIVILGAITYIYGNGPHDWRFYVLPLIVPAMIGATLLVTYARQYHDEHINDQPHNSLEYRLYVSHKSECDILDDDFYTSSWVAGDVNGPQTHVINDDNIVEIINKTGVDVKALNQRIDELHSYALASSWTGDCKDGGTSQAAADRIDAMYAKVGPLESDMKKFDDAYHAAFTATYGLVAPEDDTSAIYDWN